MKAIATSQIVIQDAYVKNAQEKLEHYLISLDPKMFLFEFYQVAQLPPLTTEGYQGWERSDQVNFRGHFFGHFMSACALAFQSTHDEKIKKILLAKMKLAITSLAEIQEAYGKIHPKSKGYLSAFREVALDEVEGKSVPEKEKENCLVPWYNLHKILAGLLDISEYTWPKDQALSKLALKVAQEFGTYIYLRLTKLQDKSKMLAVEYGGMNEALYRLYQLTGNDQYAEAASYFDEVSLFEKLALKQDVLPGKHANTTIPKLTGALKRYQVLQASEAQKNLTSTEIQQLPLYLQAAKNFWELVVTQHSYCTGGNSQGEHFHQPGELFHDAFGKGGECTCETCNTYNMLKLSRGLYEVTKEVKYLNFYEKVYINAILAAQNPKNGMMMYFQPMGAGYNKVYNRPFDEFWCCTGTGIESFSKLADTYYYEENGIIYVNLYFSNELTLPAYNAVLLQQTDRQKGSSSFSVKPLDPRYPTIPFKLAFRLPDWSKAWSLKINSKKEGADLQNGFIVPNFVIKNGSKWQLDLTPALTVNSTFDNPHYLAFQYGPYVLAAELGKEKVNLDQPNGILVRAATKLASLPEQLWLEQGDVATITQHLHLVNLPGKLLAFKTNHLTPALTFTPYYELHDQRYGIYFQTTTNVADIMAKSTEKSPTPLIELNNFDGNNSEYAFRLKYQASKIEEKGGKSYRQSLENGWFSYVFTPPKNQRLTKMTLLLRATTPNTAVKVVFNHDAKFTKIMEATSNQEELTQVKLAIPPELQTESSLEVLFTGLDGHKSPEIYQIALFS